MIHIYYTYILFTIWALSDPLQTRNAPDLRLQVGSLPRVIHETHEHMEVSSSTPSCDLESAGHFGGGNAMTLRGTFVDPCERDGSMTEVT